MAKTTYTAGQFTLTAPPLIHFAFNPWPFTFARGAVDGAEEEISYLSFGGDRRELYDRTVAFDLRRRVQSLFEGTIESGLAALDYSKENLGVSPLVQQFTTPAATQINVSGVESAMAGDYQVERYALWGGIARGETYGADETLPWWPNYPFSVDLWQNGGTVLVNGSAPGGTSAYYNGHHYYNPVSLTVTGKVMLTAGSHLRISGQEETWEERAVTLVPQNAPLDMHERIYVRWVDSMGRLRYHLFTRTGQTEAVAASSWNRADDPEPEIYDGYVNDAQTSRQQLTATRTLTAGAPALDLEEFERLVTVCRSPIVDVFDGYDGDGNALWHRVNVGSGSYKRDSAHYADLSFTLTDRIQITQLL